MSHSRISWIVVIALLPAISGCVSQGELDRFRDLYRTSQGQVIDLKARIDELNDMIRSLRTAPKVADPALLARLKQLQDERKAMLDQLDTLEQQIRDAALKQVPLPPAIDEALQQLAAQHAEVMEYDADAGMIRMRSDLTFSSGSATVSNPAKNTLADLALILRAVVAQGYEVRVVGHTDDQKIVRAAAQHPTNWHLSVHRAIAVKDVLEQAGVPPTKLGVAGYGEFRPIAPNGAKGNRANRRVEIYIVTASAPAALAPADAGPPPLEAPEPQAPAQEPMK